MTGILWSSYHLKKRAEPKSQKSRNLKENFYVRQYRFPAQGFKSASGKEIYRAFTESLAIASWLPPYGFLCSVQEMNVKVGGTYKMFFQNFSAGNSHSFHGKYLSLKKMNC